MFCFNCIEQRSRKELQGRLGIFLLTNIVFGASLMGINKALLIDVVLVEFCTSQTIPFIKGLSGYRSLGTTNLS